MTQLLVRVADARDAALAAAANVDAIEYEVSGAFDRTALDTVRRAFPGTLRLKIEAAPALVEAVRAEADGLVDEIACVPALLAAATVPPQRLILRLAHAAELASVAALPPNAAGVVLDGGPSERLIGKEGVKALDAFAARCRDLRIPFGFSGGLESPDVVRLLLLQPDVLGFDAAVRVGHDAKAPLDPEALDAIRALIPRGTSTPSPAAAITKVMDRIFVRDFEVPFVIGAYKSEHGRTQRVRFSVTADTMRSPGVPHDMRDVFSYDIIIETIRVLADRGHVTFVETLAEEVAASLLTHHEVMAVEVKVEKLDVVAGIVGIEITRRREA